MLLPLLLVPLLHRRWRAVAVTIVPAGAALLLAVLTVPAGRSFGRVLVYCLTGTNLHGANALNNLSLRGWVEAHGRPAVAGLVAAALIGGVSVSSLAVRARRRRHAMAPAQMSNLAVLAVLLAGSISEVHFLLVVVATTLAQLVLRPSRRQTLCTLPGLVMLALPSGYVGLLHGTGEHRQSWYVLGELVLFAAVVAGPGMARRQPPGSAGTAEPRPGALVSVGSGLR